MKRSTAHRSGLALAAALTMFGAACGSKDPMSVVPPTSTVAKTATSTATPLPPEPTRTATSAPTPTSSPGTAGVSGLVVVNHSLAPNAGDQLGAPPARWMEETDAPSFDKSLSNADWSIVGGADKRGVTTSDGQFSIGDLPPGQYTLQVTKTLDGNLLPVTIPFSVGDDGKADVVAELAWGLIRTTSTYTKDGAQVREVHAPNGTVLVSRDGRVSELDASGRTLIDADGDGRFDVTPCADQTSSCASDAACPEGRFCQCVSGCFACDSCSLPGVCLPKGSPPPYACGADRSCTQPGDRCVCVPSCPQCDDCPRSVCASACAPVEITGVTITGGPSQLVVGRQGQIYAIAELSDGTQIDVTYLVTWTSSDESVATVDSWGTVSALAVGNTNLTATLGTAGGATTPLTSAPWPLQVVERPTLQHILVRNQACYCGPVLLAGPQNDAAMPPPCVLAPATRTDVLPVPNCGDVVQVGATLQFNAIGQFADGSYQDITKDVQWQVMPAAVGDVVAGLFTARMAGTATLTAALDNVVSDPTDIRVVTEPTVVALSIYADNAVVAVANAPVPGGVAIPCAAAGPQADLCCCPGPMTADASAPCGCGYSITVLRGDELKFHATAQYDTGEWRDVTDQVTWRSSDSATATIDSAGVMTAVQGGDATIDAVLGSIASNPVGVHVVNSATLLSLYVYQDGAYQSSVIAKGDQRFLKAMGNYDVGFSRDVTTTATWRSSDESVGGFDTPGVFTGRSAGTVQVWAELDGQQSNHVSLEVYEVSELNYCDAANVNRSVWSDDYNRVTLESDCATYTAPGVATLRYTVTETQPHGGIFNPCLDLYVYDGSKRVRTIREEGCGDPFLAANAPGRDQEALKYQLRAFWDLKDESGNPVSPGTYTIYGRFYLYYDPVVKLAVTVLPSDGSVPTPTPTATVGPVCTPPLCKAGEVLSCPGTCPGGCGTVCVATEGFCLHGPLSDCSGSGLAISQAECCKLAEVSASPLPFFWCPADASMGSCSVCTDPCAGLPPPAPTPTLSLCCDPRLGIPCPLGVVCPPATPVPLPTFGDCDLACDGRPCLGVCPDGQTAKGKCSAMTINRGCECVLDCGPLGTPTPTPVPPPTPPVEGACFKGSSSCGGPSFLTSQSACCVLAQGLGPAAISWCPIDQLDAMGSCGACAAPCEGMPVPLLH